MFYRRASVLEILAECQPNRFNQRPPSQIDAAAKKLSRTRSHPNPHRSGAPVELSDLDRRNDVQQGTTAACVHGCVCSECREHQRSGWRGIAASALSASRAARRAAKASASKVRITFSRSGPSAPLRHLDRSYGVDRRELLLLKVDKHRPVTVVRQDRVASLVGTCPASIVRPLVAPRFLWRRTRTFAKSATSTASPRGSRTADARARNGRFQRLAVRRFPCSTCSQQPPGGQGHPRRGWSRS
jgi:hypothetical protein